MNGLGRRLFGFTISRVKGGSIWIAFRTRENEVPALVTVLRKWVAK